MLVRKLGEIIFKECRLGLTLMTPKMIWRQEYL